MSHRIYLGLGSNLGDRLAYIQRACEALQQLPLADFQCASIYESLAYQGMEQPNYYNTVVSGFTTLSPKALMEACLAIERECGRVRRHHWDSRTIDIDILYYDQAIVYTDHLIIPHYDLIHRPFFLMPLFELNPSWVDPQQECTIKQLWQYWKKQNPNEALPQKVSP